MAEPRKVKRYNSFESPHPALRRYNGMHSNSEIKKVVKTILKQNKGMTIHPHDKGGVIIHHNGVEVGTTIDYNRKDY